MMFGSRKVVNLLEILHSYSQVYARFCCMIGGQITSLLSCASNSAEFAASLLVVRAQLEALRPEAAQAGLRLTMREMERISSILDNEFLCRPSTLRDWLLNLQSRLEDELAERVFLQVSPERAERFDHPTRGWDDIISRFPAGISDVEEMSKCFALSRYPSCVFHSMQIVEHGLIKLGATLRVHDPKPGWVATTQELKRITKKPYGQRTSWERSNYSFIEQMEATVEALKNAWRNKIDHASGRLTLLPGDFSPDIAEEIMLAARAFMRRLFTDTPVEVRPESDMLGGQPNG